MFASEKDEGRLCIYLLLFLFRSRSKKLSLLSMTRATMGPSSRFHTNPTDVNSFVHTKTQVRYRRRDDDRSCRVCIPNRSLRTPLLSRGVFVRRSSRRERPSAGEVGRMVADAIARLARRPRCLVPIGPFEWLNVACIVPPSAYLQDRS